MSVLANLKSDVHIWCRNNLTRNKICWGEWGNEVSVTICMNFILGNLLFAIFSVHFTLSSSLLFSEVDHDESDVDELSFVLEPLDTVAIPSNSVILNCQAHTSESAAGMVEIQWTKDNKIVSVSSSR